MVFIENLFLSLLLYPFLTFIHELGHGFFVKLFRGEIIRIGFGTGENVFQIKKFHIGSQLKWQGYIQFTFPEKISRNKEILVLLGGVLFNFTTGAVIWFIVSLYDIASTLLGLSITISFMMVIINLLPLTFSDGTVSDGKQILTLLKEERAENISIRKD